MNSTAYRIIDITSHNECGHMALLTEGKTYPVPFYKYGPPDGGGEGQTRQGPSPIFNHTSASKAVLDLERRLRVLP